METVAKVPEAKEDLSREEEDVVFALEVAETSVRDPELSIATTRASAEEELQLRREESETPLCRKVLPTLEEEENVCSICLDDFTDPDPSIPTSCG